MLSHSVYARWGRIWILVSGKQVRAWVGAWVGARWLCGDDVVGVEKLSPTASTTYHPIDKHVFYKWPGL